MTDYILIVDVMNQEYGWDVECFSILAENKEDAMVKVKKLWLELTETRDISNNMLLTEHVEDIDSAGWAQEKIEEEERKKLAQLKRKYEPETLTLADYFRRDGWDK